ncbi:MAG TPA: maltose alpha-D-glucosyltransferase [Bryobacteraceae bacterium]|jgi:maltose alpha-D-glucosyltransferase/alpha-amylase|nr:maltose alpha-D-glucosyltransferase [Bryobacteraceae bacterium]
MKRQGSASDPLWYKDAIIYELHVRAFADGNNDGVGDFQGLIQKLDYLQELGVTCLWLLPFFPSPLKDDGYDISDYFSVHPSYGTMEDFQEFLTAAHDRGLQVIIELVMNHTSDQHPWFQRARTAPPGSPERNYYVWSDTDQKYREARIIFTDTEKSNWTWDPVAKQYYWHRFFSHQPDLNYDHPQVVEEMLTVLRFWLDRGVDGLRMDAIPYLFERDGTNCENLPETHQLIKRFRREMDEGYSNRMILAEANQWPSDVRPYFADGDECHMAFHFPLMPRIYMALRQEDRLPITDIMAQTPEIPENCQWALFLRNHDELTLEMVTNDERDYMYLAYSADPRMRINLGIRRRLAPLMDNNRRRIELLNSLLLSFPGTPIIYYGDEIGMGDNIYLGDRNGVRTPMQWNSDRNAGFSRATPAKLYSPVIMDPVWGYQAVNVEAQQSDPSSLLNWMRNMIALRKLFRVFGRGTLEFLNPENRKILAYVRRWGDEQVLCIANLSRFAQPVDLDLSEFEGMAPVEMLGYVEFPAITRQPYRFTLSAYGFLWLELHGAPQRIEEARGSDEPAILTIGAGWTSLFEGAARHRFEAVALPEYFPKQRWFGGKSRTIRTAHVMDWTGVDRPHAALALVEVEYEQGPPETYFVPIAISLDRAADQIRESAAGAVIASVVTPEGPGILHDGLYDDEACVTLLGLIVHGRELGTRRGKIRGAPSALLAQAQDGYVSIRRGSGEQSNSSIVYGDKFILKLFRRFQPGPNPDSEVEKFLTEKARFDRVPPFAGAIEYEPGAPEPATLGVLEGLVENEGDAWKWTVEELERYYETNAPAAFPPEALNDTQDVVTLSEQPTPQFARDHVGLYLESAATLGRRTGELHRALATGADDPAFAPEPLTEQNVRDLLETWREQALDAFRVLKENVSRLPDDAVDQAALVLGRRREFLNRLRISASDGAQGMRIRIHGDYHLGQILRVKTDYVILDFEGEPSRPLAERRAKQSPLKDVAGMLRSFSYAAYATLVNWSARRGEDAARLEPWARLWDRYSAVEFLRGYREATAGAEFLPSNAAAFRILLGGFRLSKALYEVLYELNNRPSWVRIPLMGILDLPA